MNILSNRNKSIDKLTWIMPAILLLVFSISYLPLIRKLNIRWNSADNNYCYLIVPLFIYLCYEKRKEIRFGLFSWNFIGFVAVISSVLIMCVGEFSSMETILYLGIWGCIAGTMSILYGRRLKHLKFPLFILGFIIPLPPFVSRILTFNLKLMASSFSVLLLRLAGVSVLHNGNIIDIGICRLQVADACSGLRFFYPLVLMALLFGYFSCKRIWHKIFLLVISLPLSIFVNGLRIFLTGMLYTWGLPALAEHFFHDFSGWIIFIFTGFILFAFTVLLGRTETNITTKSIVDNGGRAVNSLVPVITITLLCFVFLLSGSILQNLPSSAHLPYRKSFQKFPMAIGKWSAKREYLSQEILENLWADDYISATYYRNDLTNTIHLFIPFYAYQGTMHTGHTPQSCMLGTGWALIGSREKIVPTDMGIDLPIMTNVWKKGDTCILGSYFFYQRGRVFTSPWMNKYWLMVDAFTKQRTDGALVRIEIVLSPGQSMEEAYAILEEFTTEVFWILPEFVPL